MVVIDDIPVKANHSISFIKKGSVRIPAFSCLPVKEYEARGATGKYKNIAKLKKFFHLLFPRVQPISRLSGFQLH